MTGRRGKVEAGTEDEPCVACTNEWSHHGCVVWGNMCDCTGEADRMEALEWFFGRLAELPPARPLRRKRPRGQRPA